MGRPIKASELQGAFVATITPMLFDDKIRHDIDYDKLDMLLEDFVDAQIGIVACGTTGQSATLRPNEQVDIIEHIYNFLENVDPNKTIPFIASAGSNDTAEAVDLSKAIEDRIGATTFLHVTGYYNIPPQEGLIKHYTTLADSLSGASNLVLYNVPSRVIVNLEPSTVNTLAKHDKIVGIKQARCSLDQHTAIISGTDQNNFRLLSGDDDLVIPTMKAGGYGTISASANIAPKYFRQMVDSYLRGNTEKAELMQENILPLVKAVFSCKNPMPLAYMFGTNVRSPMVNVPELNNGKEIMEKIDNALNQYPSAKLGIDYTRYRSR